MWDLLSGVCLLHPDFEGVVAGQHRADADLLGDPKEGEVVCYIKREHNKAGHLTGDKKT